MDHDGSLTINETAAEPGSDFYRLGTVPVALLFALFAGLLMLTLSSLTEAVSLSTLAGTVTGAAIGGGVIARQHAQLPTRWLRFGPDGVTRFVGNRSLPVPWSQVTSVAAVRNRVTRARMVVVVTDPADTLVPSERLLQKRAKFNKRSYNGSVVVPLAATRLDEDSFAALIAQLSEGRVEVGSGRARG